MPPSMAMTLLKAVASSPSHHHPPHHRHLIHGRKQNPSPHTFGHHGWAPRVAPSSPTHAPRSAPTPTGTNIYSTVAATRGNRFRTNGRVGGRVVAKGAPRLSGWWWWMGIAAGRTPSGAGERGCSLRVLRKCAGGGPDGGGGEGSDGWVGLAAQQQQQQGEPPVMGFLRHHQQNGHGGGEDGDVGVDNGNGKQPPAPAHQSSKLMTIPTVLTLGRVAAVPLLVITFYMDNQWATTATTGIFIAAAVTDWLDGYIARKMRLGTAFGAFLDPVADKLMVAATLVLLCTKPLEVAAFGQMPWLLTVPAIAIIGREITMSAVREWAASQNSKVLEAVAVNNLGKWKTATQMTALTILLASRDSSLSAPGFLVASGAFLLHVSAMLAIWSLAVYMRKIWRILLK